MVWIITLGVVTGFVLWYLFEYDDFGDFAT